MGMAEQNAGQEIRAQLRREVLDPLQETAKEAKDPDISELTNKVAGAINTLPEFALKRVDNMSQAMQEMHTARNTFLEIRRASLRATQQDPDRLEAYRLRHQTELDDANMAKLQEHEETIREFERTNPEKARQMRNADRAEMDNKLKETAKWVETTPDLLAEIKQDRAKFERFKRKYSAGTTDEQADKLLSNDIKVIIRNQGMLHALSEVRDMITTEDAKAMLDQRIQQVGASEQAVSIIGYGARGLVPYPLMEGKSPDQRKAIALLQLEQSAALPGLKALPQAEREAALTRYIDATIESLDISRMEYEHRTMEGKPGADLLGKIRDNAAARFEAKQADFMERMETGKVAPKEPGKQPQAVVPPEMQKLVTEYHASKDNFVSGHKPQVAAGTAPGKGTKLFM